MCVSLKPAPIRGVPTPPLLPLPLPQVPVYALRQRARALDQ